MIVKGDYILGETGTLEIEIGGFDPGQFDFFDITGTAFLTGGTIEMLFLDAYDITTDVIFGQTRSLMFLNAGTIDTFASAIDYDFLGTPSGFIYDVFQQDNALYFQATNTNTNTNPIPAPGALLLTTIGAAIVTRMRKRIQL